DPNAQTWNEQRPKAPSQTGSESHQAPQEHAASEQPLSRPRVRQPTQRHSNHGIKQDECGAQRAESLVRNLPLVPNPLLYSRQNLPVKKVHRVDGKQDEKGKGYVPASWHEEILTMKHTKLTKKVQSSSVVHVFASAIQSP